MIATITLGYSVHGVGRYLTSEVSSGNQARAVTFRFDNLGLDDALADPEIAGRVSRAHEFRLGMAALGAVADSRSDLKYRVALLSVSPNPQIALQRGPSKTRADCFYVVDRVADQLGLRDRARLIVVHGDGHRTWKAHNPNAGQVEHVHAAYALPDLTSGRSIQLHQIRRRAQAAARDAARELGLPAAPVETHTVALDTPSPLASPTEVKPTPSVARPTKRRASADLGR